MARDEKGKGSRRGSARPARVGAKARRVTSAAKGTTRPGKARKASKARGGKKMKAYASFDLYLADQPARNQRLIRALRRFVRRLAPTLRESVKWGNGCWLKQGVPVAYVYSDVDHVHFGFVRGSSLSDPRGLLQGQGQYVRHVKVRTLTDIDEAALGAFLRQAVRVSPGR